MHNSRWIEDGREGLQLIQSAGKPFGIMTVKRQRDVGQFMLVPGHLAGPRLAQFSQQHVLLGLVPDHGGVKLASAERLTGLADAFRHIVLTPKVRIRDGVT